MANLARAKNDSALSKQCPQRENPVRDDITDDGSVVYGISKLIMLKVVGSDR